MKLIVNKTTGRIENDYLLAYGDFECKSLLDSWTDINGNINLMPDTKLVSIPDDAYDFSGSNDGHTNTYYYIDNQIVLKKIIEPEYVRQQIEALELELKKTDYKVIKAYEAQLVGLNVPYDFGIVHEERQAVRDKINELKSLLNQEGGVI